MLYNKKPLLQRGILCPGERLLVEFSCEDLVEGFRGQLAAENALRRTGRRSDRLRSVCLDREDHELDLRVVPCQPAGLHVVVHGNEDHEHGLRRKLRMFAVGLVGVEPLEGLRQISDDDHLSVIAPVRQLFHTFDDAAVVQGVVAGTPGTYDTKHTPHGHGLLLVSTESYS